MNIKTSILHVVVALLLLLLLLRLNGEYFSMNTKETKLPTTAEDTGRKNPKLNSSNNNENEQLVNNEERMFNELSTQSINIKNDVFNKYDNKNEEVDDASMQNDKKPVDSKLNSLIKDNLKEENLKLSTTTNSDINELKFFVGTKSSENDESSDFNIKKSEKLNSISSIKDDSSNYFTKNSLIYKKTLAYHLLIILIEIQIILKLMRFLKKNLKK
ncbi:hypothetical protein A0H76_457 [Hepatospora eriocheir]|uniref:Uncharacterized protein n=1 Tax=Hepatospora eriocheir TaxID=1081669 RepID=A0A1X0Q9Q8_9MICR|nr:hypothetical protein A0H76_457 [Hepatospora eriocheir]